MLSLTLANIGIEVLCLCFCPELIDFTYYLQSSGTCLLYHFLILVIKMFSHKIMFAKVYHKESLYWQRHTIMSHVDVRLFPPGKYVPSSSHLLIRFLVSSSLRHSHPRQNYAYNQRLFNLSHSEFRMHVSISLSSLPDMLQTPHSIF